MAGGGQAGCCLLWLLFAVATGAAVLPRLAARSRPVRLRWLLAAAVQQKAGLLLRPSLC